MKNRQSFSKLLKDKTFLGVILSFLVVMAVLAGAVAMDNKSRSEMDFGDNVTSQDIDERESMQRITGREQTPNNQTNSLENDKENISSNDNNLIDETESESEEGELQSTNQNDETKSASDVVSAAIATENLSFGDDSEMVWPVEGQVIIPFSMDATTFFSTLNEYKCNPGMLLSADENMEVKCAVKGVVSATGSNEEIGNFVTLSLGNNYSLTYGQLNETNLEIGQVVDKDKVIGTVAKPTKYYQLEGYNVYLELKQGDVPVDPLDYLNYDEVAGENAVAED